MVLYECGLDMQQIWAHVRITSIQRLQCHLHCFLALFSGGPQILLVVPESPDHSCLLKSSHSTVLHWLLIKDFFACPKHILIFALAFCVPRNYCFCKMVEYLVKKHKLIKRSKNIGFHWNMIFLIYIEGIEEVKYIL